MALHALINKKVIPFVCNGKKVTIEYICDKTKFTMSNVSKWLDVEDVSLPTINQAKKIAKCLHIPFAGLYMNTEDINIKSIPSIVNNRTFDGSLSVDDSGFNIAICDVIQERDFLIDQRVEMDISLPLFSAPECSDADDPEVWAQKIRHHYSIFLQDQYKCSSARKFYLYLRDRLEQNGIFVQCFTDVPIEVVRGFSIYQNDFPIIGINDEDRPPAKSFSLIHELVHIIKRESSACNVMFNATSSYKEEVFCNAVAGELLVPQDALRAMIYKEDYDRPFSIDSIAQIAEKFSVSKEVIIRRLLDCKYIDSSEYGMYAEEFRKMIEREREEQRIARKEGINKGFRKSVSQEAIDRTSSNVCRTLFYGYGEDLYSKRDIAQHLNIAPKHVDKFLVEVSKWSN